MKKYISISCVLGLFALACNQTESSEAEAEFAPENSLEISQSQFQTGGMKLIKAETRAFKREIFCNGLIDVPPQNKAIVSAIMGGYVKKSPLLVGDKVKAGQFLLSMENTEFIDLQEAYLEATAEAEYLKIEYDRKKTLHDEKISSSQDFGKVKSEWQMAAARQHGLGRKLEMLNINPAELAPENISSTVNIYSPIGGRISKVNIDLGKYVSKADLIMEIIDASHLHLELNVFEKDLQHIEIGQKIGFRIPEASDKMHEGTVHLIGNTVDLESRTIKVHGHLEEEDEQYAVGMFIEAEIAYLSDSLLAIPELAVSQEESGQYVYVYDKKQDSSLNFRKVEIQVQRQQDGFFGLDRNMSWDMKQEILLGAYHFTGETEGEE